MMLSSKGVYLTLPYCTHIFACLCRLIFTCQQCCFSLSSPIAHPAFTFALLFPPLSHPYLITNCAPSHSPIIQAL